MVTMALPKKMEQRMAEQADETTGDAAAELLENGATTDSTDDTDVIDESAAGESASVVVSELPEDFAGEAVKTESGERKAEEVSPEVKPLNVTWKPSSDSLAKFDAELEWKQRLREINDEFMELAIEEKKAKEHAKELKKAMDEKVKQRQRLLNRGPEVTPLFDRPVPIENSWPINSAPVNPVVFTPEIVATIASESWRSASILDLDLSDSLTEKLEESNVSTIGQLEDLRAEIALGKSKWPKGIGEAKITKIEDAVIAWLTAHRDSSVFQAAEKELTTEHTEDTKEENTDAVAAEENLGEPISVVIKKAIRIQGNELLPDEMYDVQRNSEGVLSAILPDGKGLVELSDDEYTVFKRQSIEDEPEEVEPDDEPASDSLDDL